MDIHFKVFGPCLLQACPSIADRQGKTLSLSVSGVQICLSRKTDYVYTFMETCNGTFPDPPTNGDFGSKDLLQDLSSSSVPASTADPESETVVTMTNSDVPPVFSMDPASENSPSSTAQQPITTATSKSNDSPSSAPPQPSTISRPTPQASSAVPAVPSSTVQGKESVPVVAVPPTANSDSFKPPLRGQTDTSTHDHVTVATTIQTKSTPLSSSSSEPAFSTTAIAGTAAGGTVGIALIIGLVYFLMRRRKRRASMASSEHMWDPATHNTDRKPTFPVLQNDSAFGRYCDANGQQMTKAELHSDVLLPPPPQTPNQGPFETSGIQDEGKVGNMQYYQPPHDYQNGNYDSRYPELPSHPVKPLSSPTSPISAVSSTPHVWHSSNTPTLRFSNADLRSDSLRSPLSELGGNAPSRSTRSAELGGEEVRGSRSESPVELHNETLLPPKFGGSGLGDGHEMVGMEGGSGGNGMKVRVPTNL